MNRGLGENRNLSELQIGAAVMPFRRAGFEIEISDSLIRGIGLQEVEVHVHCVVRRERQLAAAFQPPILIGDHDGLGKLLSARKDGANRIAVLIVKVPGV